ncbi:MAG: hypothetical protein R3F42_13010 [Pseudomonadota bacterium]
MIAKWGRRLAILATLFITGCATTGRDLVRDNTVQIEKVSSRWATVRSVNVVQEDGEVTLRGEVVRWPPVRGSIPGHIDLQVIGPDGEIVKEAVIEYHRRSVKARYATFHTTLKPATAAGSTIRVTHDTRAVFSCKQLHCE